MISPTLHTKRLTLRMPRASDFEIDLEFSRSDRCLAFGEKRNSDETFNPLAFNIGHWALKGFGAWAVEDTNDHTYFGRIGVMQMPSWEYPELGWVLTNPVAEGTGIAYEAAIAAREHAFTTLDFPKLVSTIRVSNERSIKMAKRLGATYVNTQETPKHGQCEIYAHERIAA